MADNGMNFVESSNGTSEMDDLQFMDALLENDGASFLSKEMDLTAIVSTTQAMIMPAPRSRKRPKEFASAISEDEGEKQRRRMDRNLREQQRSHRITEKIGHLRDVLANANVHFKPDKYSTLVSVVEYIKRLQSRSSMLDAQHKKLLDTIAQTNDAVNRPYEQLDLLSDAPPNAVLQDETAVFVQGLDYKNVFRQCGIALAIASIDGRFMDCNPEFEQLTGYSRSELLHQPDNSSSNSSSGRNLSLFNLLGRQDMEQVFLAMSRMLKQPIDAVRPADYWSGNVSQSRQDTSVHMNVTLVRSPMGRPKFFQCALSPTAP